MFIAVESGLTSVLLSEIWNEMDDLFRIRSIIIIIGKKRRF